MSKAQYNISARIEYNEKALQHVVNRQVINQMNALRLYREFIESGIKDKEQERYLKILNAVSFDLVSLKNSPTNSYELDYHKLPEILDLKDESTLDQIYILLKYHIDSLYRVLNEYREIDKTPYVEPTDFKELMELRNIAKDENLMEHERIEKIAEGYNEIQKGKNHYAYSSSSYQYFEEYKSDAEAAATGEALDHLLKLK
ncbi:hypothetical protein [Halobacteriovorax sp. YZS-1-1]|uniref:hypothetical protein n=1 Tax=unclassified Halobacteriovorax TaxID=2639665 RepID=UPI00399BB045